MGQVAEFAPRRAAAILSRLEIPAGDSHWHTVAKAYARAEPRAAHAWLVSLPQKFQSTLLAHVYEELGAKDAVDVLRKAAAIPNEDDRKFVLQRVVASWLERDPDAVLPALPVLIGEARTEAVVRLLDAKATKKPEEAAQLLLDLRGQGLLEIPGLAKQAAEKVTARWALTSPASAAAWMEKLPTGQTRDHFTAGLAEAWLDEDFDTATAWIQRQPASPGRDQAVGHVVAFLQEKDPAAALLWAERLPAGEAKEQAHRAIFRYYLKSDHQAAANALETAPVSPELRRELLEKPNTEEK